MKPKDYLKIALLCVLIALLVGTASAVFLYALQAVTVYREAHWVLIYFLPLAGFGVGWMYLKFGKEVEKGNNLIIENLHHPQQKIPLKMAPMIFLSTLITHLFGGSAGREGTALQMAVSFSSVFRKPLKLTDNQHHTAIIAAVAAGFSSVFGTPLAGTFFALEFYRVGKINYSNLFVALFCALSADWVCRFWNASHTHYAIDFTPKISIYTLGLVIFVSLIFGICAKIFSEGLYLCSQFFKQKIQYTPLRPFVGGLLVVLGYVFLGDVQFLGLGIPTIIDSFHHLLPPHVFALKIMFTIITLASGFKGGEVTPLFFIGATLGNALAWFVPLPLDLLSALGFVAVFAGATKTPLACTFMAIELFDTGSGTLYFCVACMVSYWVSGRSTIYRSQFSEVKK